MKKIYRKALCIVLVFGLLGFASPAITAQANANASPMLAAGGNHVIALKDNGSVWAWGDNSYGILGAGLIDGVRPPVHDTPVPVLNGGLSSAISVAARDLHSVALHSDGTVWAWGVNSYGQLGDGSTNHFPSPVQTKNLSDATAAAAGRWHSLALLPDGTVWAWGNNENGQLGDGATTNSFLPVQVQISDVSAIAAGEMHSVALKNDGSIWAWGNNSAGQLGDGTKTQRNTPIQVQGLSNITAIAAGFNHTLALKSDGSVWAWGFNWQGQLGDGTNTNRNVPMQVNNLSDITAIAAGEMHTLAVKNDGTAWAFGDNRQGQLGNGLTTSSSDPVQMQALEDVISVTAGKNHSAALRGDGTVWVVGSNALGQLGNGTTTNSAIPVQVKGPNGAGFLNLLSSPPTIIPAESVSITGENVRNLIVCNSIVLTANVAPASATNKSVSWISSNPAVATVNAAGDVQAMAEGEATITAKTACGSHTAAITVNVTPIRVTGVSIAGDATRWTMVGFSGEITLTAAVTPADASNQNVTWSSSDPAVATVDASGRVIMRSIGNASITATSEDGGHTASVLVIVRVPLQYVSIDGDRYLTLTAGREHQLTTSFTPENATIKTVTWTTTNEAVATVDQTGLVRAIGPGNAVIVVTSEDGNRASAVNIAVKAAATPPSFSEGKNTTLRYRGSKKLGVNSSADIIGWASDNPSVVSVENGKITGHIRGTARIIAIDQNGASAEIDVTVKYVWWQWLIVIFLGGWVWY
jgi:alpha-tubulin suppressor-like RCC1 family protein/uncharacterized protein YjdB